MSETPRPDAPGLDFPVATDLGMDATFPDAGHCLVGAEATERHLNPNGVVHGAAIFAVVDTSMGGATMNVLDPGQFCASIEVHLRFLQPLRPGSFTVDTRVVRAGKRVAQLESRVTDADGQLVATATGTYAILGSPR